MAVYVIAAMARNRVIGCNGAIPWHISKDFEFFKRTTMGHTCVMGSRTYNSLPASVRPLPGRKNVVVTRDVNKKIPGVVMCYSWHDVVSLCQSGCQSGETIYLCGGSQMYQAGLEIADTLLLTHIDADIEGDTFFPWIDDDCWQEVSRVDTTDINTVTGQLVSFSFVRYERIKQRSV